MLIYSTLLKAINVVQEYRLWKRDTFRNHEACIIARKNVKIAFFLKKMYEKDINVYVVLWGNFQFNKSFVLEV
jgi:hypothetical protein